jgi:ketosteroid isomerase-like protein
VSAGATPQDNVEVVRRALAAFKEGDIEAVLQYYTADVLMRNPLSRIEGDYKGHDGLRRFYADVGAAEGAFTLSVEALEPVGEERVLATIRITARGQTSDIPFIEGASTSDVYELRDGLICGVHTFLDPAKAREAAGQRE